MFCIFMCTANQTRKFSSPTDVQITDDEYVMLKDAICMQDISKSFIKIQGSTCITVDG